MQKQHHSGSRLTSFVKEYDQKTGKSMFSHLSENPTEDKKTFHPRRETICRISNPFLVNII
jgi:hypothetical protein